MTTQQKLAFVSKKIQWERNEMAKEIAALTGDTWLNVMTRYNVAAYNEFGTVTCPKEQG